MPDSIYDMTYPRLRDGIGVEAHARTLWRAMYREPGTIPEREETFQRPLREWLSSRGNLSFPVAVKPGDVVPSSDGHTRRFLVTMADGQVVETVLMGYPGRFTACVSTQAGCAMGCVFCATGQQGFGRNLTPGEIVGQVLHSHKTLAEGGEGRLRNLVFMGMGEPLHNYDSTITALEIIADTRGLNIGPSRITVSTVGVVPAIRRWTAERQPWNLAVSLHSADPAERAALVPASKRWPLGDLIAACREYCDTMQRRIFFGWTLIRGKNDRPLDAEKVAALLHGLDAHVNLIPLNPTDGYDGEAGASEAAREFQSLLRAAGIPSTVRQRRGIDVAAGCGQLTNLKQSLQVVANP